MVVFDVHALPQKAFYRPYENMNLGVVAIQDSFDNVRYFISVQICAQNPWYESEKNDFGDQKFYESVINA